MGTIVRHLQFDISTWKHTTHKNVDSERWCLLGIHFEMKSHIICWFQVYWEIHWWSLIKPKNIVHTILNTVRLWMSVRINLTSEHHLTRDIYNQRMSVKFGSIWIKTCGDIDVNSFSTFKWNLLFFLNYISNTVFYSFSTMHYCGILEFWAT